MFGRGKRRNGESDEASDVYHGLRAMTLDAVANGLPAPSGDHPDVSGLVVDIPAESGFVTLVALTDDTTSVYTSVGGGTIGAGEHAPVAAATQQLLSVVQTHLGLFVRADDAALPPPGQVRFHVLTPAGGRCDDLPEESFWTGRTHPLMAVTAAVQDVMTAIREVSPSG